MLYIYEGFTIDLGQTILTSAQINVRIEKTLDNRSLDD